MQTLPLQAIPNQNFSAILDDNRWGISIKTTNGVMSISMDRNNVPIIKNIRAVAGTKLIPSKYEEAGNFVITTLNNQLPDYLQFGVTQSLLYLSAAELAVIRTPHAPPITAADFDPLAAIPQRFAPTGYSILLSGAAAMVPSAGLAAHS